MEFIRVIFRSEGEVAGGRHEGGEVERRLGLRRLPARLGQRIEIELEGGNGTVDVELGGPGGVEFAEPAEGLGALGDTTATAGLAPRGALGKELDLVDVIAPRIAHAPEIGLGLGDDAIFRLAVPQATGTGDPRRVGAAAVRAGERVSWGDAEGNLRIEIN